jgi:hypothetical protein
VPLTLICAVPVRRQSTAAWLMVYRACGSSVVLLKAKKTW